MHWTYLIPLGAGLVSGYYTLRSSDEITSFTGAFTLICFLISLFIAPWELQLLLLVLVLAAARYYWRQLEAQTKIPPETDEKKSTNAIATANQQKLNGAVPPRIYRGVAYNNTDNLLVNQDKTTSKAQNQPQPPTYLGLPYETAGTPVPPLDQFSRKPKQSVDSKPTLKYRGIAVDAAEVESAEQS